MSNNVVEQTTIDSLNVDEIGDLEELGKYTYIQSRDRLNSIESILKQMLGDNYRLIIILMIVNVLLIVMLLILF